MSCRIRILDIDEIEPTLDQMAELRINIFKDFPYIYKGSKEYEVHYLSRYLESSRARFIAAFNENNKIVGMATCLPLAEEADFIQAPFLQAEIKAKIPVKDVFYFGESLLLPQYRGQGIGHRFFDLRERVAHENGAKWTSFCAVERPESHPLRPKNYRPLDAFWISRGYEKKPELRTQFSWQDINEDKESLKTMIYWLKRA